MSAFVASRPLYSREQTDTLLALFDPVHFSSRNRLAPTPSPGGRVAATRHRTPSVASAKSTVTLSQCVPPLTESSQANLPRPCRLLNSSPLPSRPPSTTSRRSSLLSLPPFLSLPPELLLHILSLALPPSTDTRLSSIAERNALLSSLARVHSSLRPFAQGELFHNVTVSTDEAIDRLIKLTLLSGTEKKGNAATLVGQISSLRVIASFTSGDGGRLLAQLVQRLPALESLHLEGLDGIEMRQFVLHPTLKHLTSTRCGFRSRFRLSPSPTPSNLLTLSLTHCTAHDDALTGFSLPHLHTLKIHSIYLPPPSALAVLEPSSAFERLGRETARQLVHLETDELHFSFFFPLAPSTLLKGQKRESTTGIKLQHLHLLRLSHPSPTLDSLPPLLHLSLRTLHLSPPSHFLPGQTSTEKQRAHFASLLAPFRASSPHLPPGLRGAEEVVLDGRYAAWLDEGEWEGVGEDMRELVERLGRGGVEVRFEENGGEGDGGRGRGRGSSLGSGGGGTGGEGGRRGSSMGALLGRGGQTVRATTVMGGGW